VDATIRVSKARGCKFAHVGDDEVFGMSKALHIAHSLSMY
jgi:hypothetical protein